MKRGLRWMRLDNAAKIYPAAKRRSWNNVFRLSATLSQPVDPIVLQSALDVTVRRFPSIAVRLRRGMFWYYLEEVETPPRVCGDSSRLLCRIPYRDIRRCAFRVLYYKNRIAAEFFHALTDGNGALVFLKTLTAEYLSQKYGRQIRNQDGVLDRAAEPGEAELEDSFLKHSGYVKGSRREATAYRLTGTPEPDGCLNLITGILDSDEVLRAARAHGVSLTVYIASAMIYCISEIQNERVPEKKRQRPIKLLIPVNLRKMFGSESLRNFVLYITPGIDPRMGDYRFEEILKTMYHQMGMELTDKQMGARITANVRAEQSPFLKVMPLFIKNIAMKAVYNLVGEKKSCLTVSNLGAVALPPEMEPYVERMDFILGEQAMCANNCGILSYRNKLYINFTRNIREPELERRFFTFLVQQGLHVKVESNHR